MTKKPTEQYVYLDSDRKLNNKLCVWLSGFKRACFAWQLKKNHMVHRNGEMFWIKNGNHGMFAWRVNGSVLKLITYLFYFGILHQILQTILFNLWIFHLVLDLNTSKVHPHEVSYYILWIISWFLVRISVQMDKLNTPPPIKMSLWLCLHTDSVCQSELKGHTNHN